MKRLSIILLAAGASSRMRGADKLMEPIDGQPLLSLMVARALTTRHPVFVTLPDLDHPRMHCIGAAQPVLVPDAAEGMAASIRSGVQALPPDCDGVMILPADMPELTTADLNLLAAAFARDDRAILRAVSLGAHGTERPGHPVVFPRRCFDALRQLGGDQGARGLLVSDHVISVPLPVEHALTDLDTPEDWQNWRNSR